MNPFDEFPKKNEVGWLDEDEVDAWRRKWEPIILETIEKLAGKQNVIDRLEEWGIIKWDGEGWMIQTIK